MGKASTQNFESSSGEGEFSKDLKKGINMSHFQTSHSYDKVSNNIISSKKNSDYQKVWELDKT